MAPVLDERNEGGALEETWNKVGTTGGAALTENSAPSDVGSPSGWGSGCIKVVTIEAQATYMYHVYSPALPLSVHSIDMVPFTDFGSDNQFCAVASGLSLVPSTAYNWFAVRIRRSGVHYLEVYTEDDGTPHLSLQVPWPIRQRFRLEVRWNQTADGVTVWVNVDISNGAGLSGAAAAQDTDIIVLGNIDAMANAHTVYYDLICGDDTNRVDLGALTFPPSGTLTLTGFAPTFSTPVVPGLGTLTLTGFAPTIQTASGGIPTPGTGSLVLTGLAPKPTIRLNNVLIQTQSLVASGTNIDYAAVPGVGSLVFTGLAPTITGVVANVPIPGTGSLVLTGLAPVILGSIVSVPGIGSLILQGFPPNAPRPLSGGTTGLFVLPPPIHGGRRH